MVRGSCLSYTVGISRSLCKDASVTYAQVALLTVVRVGFDSFHKAKSALNAIRMALWYLPRIGRTPGGDSVRSDREQ